MCGPTPSAGDVAKGIVQLRSKGAARRAHEAIWRAHRDAMSSYHPTSCWLLRMHPDTWVDIVVDLHPSEVSDTLWPMDHARLWGLPVKRDESVPYGELVVECTHQTRAVISGSEAA